MYKIAHISDIHLSYDDKNKFGEKLVELLKDIQGRECDHIIITGDLVDNPDEESFQYLREIISHFELLKSNKLSVIPGNHDIFGGAPQGMNFFTFPTICKKVVYRENEELFVNAFRESFPENSSFPYMKILGNIALIGINSVDKWSQDKNVEGSNGRVGRKALSEVKDMLNSVETKDKYKIILIHHYFNDLDDDEGYPLHNLWLKSIDWKMKIYDKKKLTTFFKKNKINLVLHGHSHINQIYNIKGVTYLNSSAAVCPITDDHLRKYNIISVPAENQKGESISIETIIL
ncbi:MAG TPA: metallophosphoesterase [Ignavibacteria bacterium]|nr:metallophosphoesterase [Ignavibacteria bacterium]HMR41099.1 metallophosphoesterase [Ignavibacteria bacterium]